MLRHLSGKAGGLRILFVWKGRATPPDGMDRRPNRGSYSCANPKVFPEEGKRLWSRAMACSLDRPPHVYVFFVGINLKTESRTTVEVFSSPMVPPFTNLASPLQKPCCESRWSFRAWRFADDPWPGRSWCLFYLLSPV